MRASRGLLPVVAFLAATGSSALVAHDGTFQPDEILRVATKDISVACETRSSAVVNGTSPGPAIHLPAGRASWIRVYNDMSDANLTMHWHGISQRMAPFSDGSPKASQWPIPPGHFFDYEVSTAKDDAGTYFYHSHIGMQALTAFGPLIVDDREPYPHHYDEERTLLWGDYFNKTDANLTAGLQDVPFVWSGETNAVLLNGQGIGIGHKPDNDKCALPVIDVEPGKTYRLRWIGATALSHIIAQLEGHENPFTVVQVDGGEKVKPITVDRMQIGSGERFDVIFKAKSTAELEKAGKNDFILQFETRERPSVYQGFAIFRYRKTKADSSAAVTTKLPAIAPFNMTNNTWDWLEYKLMPLHHEHGEGMPSLDEVTRRVVLNTVQVINPETNQTVWYLNNLTWTSSLFPSPMLVDVYKHGQAALPDYDVAVKHMGWDPRVKAFSAKTGEVLEIVFQNHGSLVDDNGGLDIHPFHAHGQHFYDVGSGNGTYDAHANEKKINDLGYKAAKRDTTMLYRYTSVTTANNTVGWRAWRIRVSNPGIWMIHCHTLQHMIMGMQTIWAVGSAKEITDIPLHESDGYLDYGGDVYGNDTHVPHYHHHFDH